MKLSDLMQGTGARGDASVCAPGGNHPPGAFDPEVARVTGDSREVGPGTVFYHKSGPGADIKAGHC